jgi:hypothetical protein
MNPQHNESAGMQLPPPVMEQAPGSEVHPESGGQNTPEQGRAVSSEKQPIVQQQGAAIPAIPLPIQPTLPAQGQQPDDSSTTSSSSQLSASDSDLIEKEWVNKAKQIVERTRDDPYRQSEQLTDIKVDYLQKRYGKSIKLSK